MIRRLAVIAFSACLLSGCALGLTGWVSVAAIGTAGAAITSDDVKMAQAYCQWRGGCQQAPAAPAAAAAP